jgi:hypothetical protein
VRLVHGDVGAKAALAERLRAALPRTKVVIHSAASLRDASGFPSVIPAGKTEYRPGTGNLAASTEAQQATASSPSMALGPGIPAGTTDLVVIPAGKTESGART